MVNMYSDALVLFADQVADGAFLFAVGHDGGRAAVDAELVFDRGADQVVAGTERTVVIDQELRHQEQRDALQSRRASGRRASTRWMMFSATSCSPQVMKILVPLTR